MTVYGISKLRQVGKLSPIEYWYFVYVCIRDLGETAYL